MTRRKPIDVDAKRVAFVVAFIATGLLLTGAILWAATGASGLFIAVAVQIGFTIALCAVLWGAWRLAKRIFPDGGR